MAVSDDGAFAGLATDQALDAELGRHGEPDEHGAGDEVGQMFGGVARGALGSNGRGDSVGGSERDDSERTICSDGGDGAIAHVGRDFEASHRIESYDAPWVGLQVFVQVFEQETSKKGVKSVRVGPEETMSRVRLGDMLIQAQMLRPEQVAEAVELQRQQGGRLGELLVELGHVSEIQLAQVLSNQLSIPWVNLYHIDFSRELLNLVPAETAEKYRCIPVYVRRVRNQGETLFVATDDPTQELALAEIAVQANMPVKPLVASSSDVRNAIRVYYFGGKASSATAPIKRRSSSIVPARSIPPVELDESELETDELAQPSVKPAKLSPPAKPASTPPAPSEPEQAKEEPAPQRRKRGKMMTLTFLDGTSVTLPTARSKKGEVPSTGEALTTRDLIAALKARAEGKDVTAVLPDGHWEPIVAATLSLLLRKGLIADWEFVEEWSKHKK